MKSLPALEFFVALFDTLLAALGVVLCCAAVVAALPPEVVANAEPVPASFDGAMPTWDGVEADTLVVAVRN